MLLVVLEAVLQVILEPIVYAYVDFVRSLASGRDLKKRTALFLKILCAIVTLLALFFILLGIFWCLDELPFRIYGIILLVVGCCIVLLHCALAFAARLNRKQEEENEENGEEESSEEDEQGEEGNEPAPLVCQVDNMDVMIGKDSLFPDDEKWK